MKNAGFNTSITASVIFIVAAAVVLFTSFSSAQSSVQLSAKQMLKISKAETMIEKVRAKYPNAEVSVVINGKTINLTAGQRVRDLVLKASSNTLWSQYRATIHLHFSLNVLKFVNQVRVAMDTQLTRFVDVISTALFGADMLRTCDRTCY